MVSFAQALLLAAALVPSSPALAHERYRCSMEILVDGTPLREYAARGTRYVEALKGREYSVRLRNRTGERVAIAVSVDGLNSIDARTTTAVEARKWVLGPYETLTLDGWQTSSTTARRFFFTTEENSYGAWLGRTKNLGLVAAAVFRERRPQPITMQRGKRRDGAAGESKDGSAPEPAPMGPAREPDAPPPPAAQEGGILPRRPADDLAATGIGQETSHPVLQVDFNSEVSPAAVLELRYEYRDTLVRLGVLPPDDLRVDPLSRREAARGFQDPGFAPDPYRRRQR